jgi:hypothetical protein
VRVDLDGEFDLAYRRLSRPYCEALDAAGIPRGLIMASFVGLERIERLPGGLYEPAMAGRLAYVTPCRADLSDSPETVDPEGTLLYGDILDLVVWRPDRPGTYLRRIGAAGWLGCREPREFDPFPVPVHPDPLTWLRAGATGLVRLRHAL